jgi:hypothetical protein
LSRVNNFKELIIFISVSCECVIWSLTLGEEHRLRVFENMVLRRIFGSKRAEVSNGRISTVNKG